MECMRMSDSDSHDDDDDDNDEDGLGAAQQGGYLQCFGHFGSTFILKSESPIYVMQHTKTRLISLIQNTKLLFLLLNKSVSLAFI